MSPNGEFSTLSRVVCSALGKTTSRKTHNQAFAVSHDKGQLFEHHLTASFVQCNHWAFHCTLVFSRVGFKSHLACPTAKEHAIHGTTCNSAASPLTEPASLTNAYSACRVRACVSDGLWPPASELGPLRAAARQTSSVCDGTVLRAACSVG